MRPAVYDPIDHRLSYMREPRKLPQLGTSLASHVMRRHAVVTVEIWYQLVDERIALELTKDR